MKPTPTPTKTAIFAANGMVVIQYNRLVGTQYVMPDQARAMAEALRALADEAAAQARHAEN